MQIGNLVLKVAGYGHDQGWTGVVLRIFPEDNELYRVEVLTKDGIELWWNAMIRIIDT